MAKTISLSTGVGNTVEVIRKGSKYIVKIDGNDYETFKLGTASSLLGASEDFPISIDEADYILAVRGNKIRLVNEGKYVDNGEEFLPQKPFPKWYYIFAVLNIAIPVISLGGLVNAAIGFCGASLCAAVANGKIQSMSVKLLICMLITLAAWVIWILFVRFVSMLY